MDKPYTLHLGNCHDVLDTLEENSVDSIVTDPPYEINFMAKSWDRAGVAFNPVTWQKALRVLKPGGHMLVFGHSRKMHRIIVAIEDAGFEIRDQLMWLYGSGFPKSHDISKSLDKKLGVEREKIKEKVRNPKTSGNGTDGTKGATRPFIEKALKENGGYHEIADNNPITPQAKQYNGWGTALKPAYEPIVLARKPFKGSVADNVLKHGVGGINIDECRVGTDDEILTRKLYDNPSWKNSSKNGQGSINDIADKLGRFPANVMHDGSKEATKDMWDWETDSDASRYFYCPKASKKDRDEGLEKDVELPASAEFRPNHMVKAINGETGNPYGRWKPIRNTHPTVKPTELMQYLVRLITPKGGTVLDPFMGSGSTGKATMIENNERNAGYKFIGIDLTEEYIGIAEARIKYGMNYQEEKAKEVEMKQNAKGQTSIFDMLEVN